MTEVKLNLIDSHQTLHGTIHGSVVDSCVAALSAEPETITELVQALARYIKPLDDHSPFATFHSTSHSMAHSSDTNPSDCTSQVEMSRGQEGGLAPALLRTVCDTLDTEPWDAGLVVIDLAARIVSCESTYSMPQPEGEVHYHDGASSTDIPVLYRLPDDWLFVNSVEAYQWSRERRTEERLTKMPLDVREILYGTPLLNFIVNECANIDPSKIAAAVQHASERILEHNAAEDAAVQSLLKNDAVVDTATEEAAADRGAGGDDFAEDPLATEISNIHARWLMTPREDLRGQSPREVLLARKDFIDFDMHTRTLQWSFVGEGPPCLPRNSHAYRFAGFGTHEFVIYYDLVRHLICTVVDSRLDISPTSNVQSPTSNVQGPTSGTGSPMSNVQGQNQQTAISIQHSAIETATQGRGSHGQEGGHAPALLSTGSSRDRSVTQVGMSNGQEGGLAPALLSISTTGQTAATQLAMSLVSTTCGSGWVNDDVGTLDHLKTDWLESPQPEYGGRIPAILIDNERKRLPEAMRPRDMIIDDDCPMCQMFGDETTPLGMGVGFWHLDGCNMDEDFAFSHYKTREEWEAENRRRDEFNAEFNRKWEERKARQQRLRPGETLEHDPFFDPDPFPGFESDDASTIFRESIDDNEELPQ